jgi:hypothetical protein
MALRISASGGEALPETVGMGAYPRVTEVATVLNNRELASAILIGLFIAACCLSGNVRSSFRPLLRNAFAWKLSLIWLAYVLVLTAAVTGLHRAGLNYAGSTKDAVVWGIVVGLPLLAKYNTLGQRPGSIRALFLRIVGLTVLVEFFVNLYVFPLWVELLWQPLVVVVMGMSAVVAERDRRNQQAKKVLDALVAALGAVIILIVAWHLIRHHDQIDAGSAALSFLQPVALSATIIVLTYAVALVSSYGLAFLRIGWSQPDRRKRMRAKAAIVVTLHARLNKIHNFAGQLPRRLSETTSWRSARRLVRDYKTGDLPQLDTEV